MALSERLRDYIYIFIYLFIINAIYLFPIGIVKYKFTF